MWVEGVWEGDWRVLALLLLRTSRDRPVMTLICVRAQPLSMGFKFGGREAAAARFTSLAFAIATPAVASASSLPGTPMCDRTCRMRTVSRPRLACTCRHVSRICRTMRRCFLPRHTPSVTLRAYSESVKISSGGASHRLAAARRSAV